jgi:hypothetical protein
MMDGDRRWAIPSGRRALPYLTKVFFCGCRTCEWLGCFREPHGGRREARVLSHVGLHHHRYRRCGASGGERPNLPSGLVDGCGGATEHVPEPSVPRRYVALALVLRVSVPADRAAEATATIDDCSIAPKSVGTDLTDRDNLASCAPGKRFRIAGKAVTNPNESRSDTISARSMTCGQGRA